MRLADLRALPQSGCRDLVVHVFGAAADYDGGEGRFRWDPLLDAADNGGTVVTPDGHVGPGRWVRVDHGHVNVAWWGLVANDQSAAAANLAAMRAAIAELARRGMTEGSVLVPPGRYWMEPIVIGPQDPAVTIEGLAAGLGVGVKLVVQQAEGGVCVDIAGPSTSWGGIKNVRIDANASGPPCRAVLRFADTHNAAGIEGAFLNGEWVADYALELGGGSQFSGRRMYTTRLAKRNLYVNAAGNRTSYAFIDGLHDVGREGFLRYSGSGGGNIAFSHQTLEAHFTPANGDIDLFLFEQVGQPMFTLSACKMQVGDQGYRSIVRRAPGAGRVHGHILATHQSAPTYDLFDEVEAGRSVPHAAPPYNVPVSV